MLSDQRQNQILDILKERQCVTVAFLSKNLYASGATIRRDLTEMGERGLIRRVRGGAALIEGINNDAPLLVRSMENRERKEKIARIALRYIKDSSALFMDSSSTVTVLAGKLTGFHNLTVVTNGLVTMNTLNENPLIKVAGSGGFIQNAATFVGQTAVDTISGFRADVFFFSCCGLSAEFGSSEAREEVAAVKRAMHRNAGKRVLLCDATKIGTDYFCRVCGLSEIDLIITDRKPEEGILAAAAGKLVWE